MLCLLVVAQHLTFTLTFPLIRQLCLRAMCGNDKGGL